MAQSGDHAVKLVCIHFQLLYLVVNIGIIKSIHVLSSVKIKKIEYERLHYRYFHKKFRWRFNLNWDIIQGIIFPQLLLIDVKMTMDRKEVIKCSKENRCVQLLFLKLSCIKVLCFLYINCHQSIILFHTGSLFNG